VIPLGTGNDFTKAFTNPEYFKDIKHQILGKAERIDLMKYNNRYSINVINIGFDCEVVCKTVDLKKKKYIPSKMAYIAGLVITLVRKPGVRAAMAKNGEEAQMRDYLLNTYANGCFCGGGFHSNPTAQLCDGQIDALFVKNISRLRFLSLVGKYKKGTHLSGKYDDILSCVKGKE
jgi:diacylglycerol kinase family enzyme